jgi:hypothetical protein
MLMSEFVASDNGWLNLRYVRRITMKEDGQLIAEVPGAINSLIWITAEQRAILGEALQARPKRGQEKHQPFIGELERRGADW